MASLWLISDCYTVAIRIDDCTTTYKYTYIISDPIYIYNICIYHKARKCCCCCVMRSNNTIRRRKKERNANGRYEYRMRHYYLRRANGSPLSKTSSFPLQDTPTTMMIIYRSSLTFCIERYCFCIIGSNRTIYGTQ